MNQTADNEKRTISIEVNGEVYADLQRMADAMNSVEWCKIVNTPESIVKEFFLCVGSYRDMCDNVTEAIYTGFEDNTPLERERIKALKAAFAAYSPVTDKAGMILSLADARNT